MEEIVRCMDCGYCDVEPWGAWCNKENAQLNDVCDEHKCDSFFPRIAKEASCQQLSKALCGKENATLGEMLEAAEQLKQRSEPENRPLTLEEIIAKLENKEWDVVWMECPVLMAAVPMCPSHRSGDTAFLLPPLLRVFTETLSNYGKTWRCWHWKPTPEQMAAAKWEE